MTINKVILVGRILGRPQVTKSTNSEFEIAFNLVTTEILKKDGKNFEHHEHSQVTMISKVAAIAYKKLKGAFDVYIEGQINTHAYIDAQNVKHYDTYVLGRSFEILYERYSPAHLTIQ